MILKSLYLKNFRSFKEKEVHFSPKINQIFGQNGQGKTNLLEAIHLLSTGRSFRTTRLAELIRHEESFFYLEAEWIQNGLSQLIKLFFDGKTKKLQIGASQHSSFSPLLGAFPLVLHAPHDALLVEGTPALRRRLVNLHLAQQTPLYVHHLSRFWHALKQRNALLKRKSSEPIACWEQEMASSALYLLEKRKIFTQALEAPLALHSKMLSQGREEHQLRYHPTFSENYGEQLQKQRKREYELGQTLSGPHRDELSFWINDKPARHFASEGQKKTAIASLKLAEWDALSSAETAPLMAIDDLGLPLDPTRQQLFYEKLATLGQVLITAPTTLSSFPSHLIEIALS